MTRICLEATERHLQTNLPKTYQLKYTSTIRSDTAMTYSNWRVYLSQARAETDRDRLLQWVSWAEEAITDRLLVVCDSENWRQEHEAAVAEMRAASEELRKLQVERLGYPDWKDTLQRS